VRWGLADHKPEAWLGCKRAACLVVGWKRGGRLRLETGPTMYMRVGIGGVQTICAKALDVLLGCLARIIRVLWTWDAL